MSINEIIIGLTGLALGGGGWIYEHYKRKHPSQLEKASMDKSTAEVIKTYAEAELKGVELTEKLQRWIEEKVHEKTAQLQEHMVRRELECSKQIEAFIKKLADETAMKEDYWDQLKDARAEVAYWKREYELLKKKHEK